MKSFLYGSLLAILAGSGPAVAWAQDGQNFYEGRSVGLYIGYGPGGAYDLYARVLANHMGKHIPGNPQIVPMNMEGAGSLLLANWLYNVAPKDGSVFATFGRSVPFFPLIAEETGSADFEADAFNWIGSANSEVSVCVGWAEAGVASYDDLLTRGMIMGGDGPGADGEQFARVMNALLDTRIEIVTGYSSGADMLLAMERGETEGRCGWSWSSVLASHPHWIADEQINVLVQIGSEPHPDLTGVPSLADLITDPEDRQVLDIVLARQPLGRPFAAPPGVPEERVKILQDAFMATMEDPAFLAEVERANLELNPLSGEEVADIVERVYANASEEVVVRSRDILRP